MYAVLKIETYENRPTCLHIFDSVADAEYFVREYKEKHPRSSKIYIENTSYSYY
ncbi:MAG: hypothetical protein MR469_02930 [Campylobacter sp.]|nr:hypothetical protein [Campylobacter sp.]